MHQVSGGPVNGPYSVHPSTTRIDIDTNIGDAFDLIVPILDDDGVPVVLDGPVASLWSARATVRRNALTATALHIWSTDAATPNALIIAGSEAAVRLLAAAEETALWAEWPSYVVGWDLDVTAPPADGEPAVPSRIAAGRFRVHPEYTR